MINECQTDDNECSVDSDDDVSQRGAAILAADLAGIFFDAAQTHFLAVEAFDAAERRWLCSGTHAVPT